MKKVKVSVNLPKDTVDFVATEAEKCGRSKTEIIRQALADYRYFGEVVDRGAEILVKEKNGTMRDIVLVSHR